MAPPSPPPPGRPSFSDAPHVDRDTLDVSDELLPVRFTWETDADGAFAMLSPEFEEAVGAHPGQYEGLMPDYVLDLLPADRRRLVAAFDRGERFSDRKVAWGVRTARLRVPVTFSGVPRYENGAFMGFRGHGSVQLADAVFDESAGLVPRMRDGAEPDEASPLDPASHRTSENEEPPKRLTEDERRAFDEIGTTLRDRAGTPVKTEGKPPTSFADDERDAPATAEASPEVGGGARTDAGDADAGGSDAPDRAHIEPSGAGTPPFAVGDAREHDAQGYDGQKGSEREDGERIVKGTDGDGRDEGNETTLAVETTPIIDSAPIADTTSASAPLDTRRRYDRSPPSFPPSSSKGAGQGGEERGQTGPGRPRAMSGLAPSRPRLKAQSQVRRSGRRVAARAAIPMRRSTDRPVGDGAVDTRTEPPSTTRFGGKARETSLTHIEDVSLAADRPNAGLADGSDTAKQANAPALAAESSVLADVVEASTSEEDMPPSEGVGEDRTSDRIDTTVPSAENEGAQNEQAGSDARPDDVTANGDASRITTPSDGFERSRTVASPSKQGEDRRTLSRRPPPARVSGSGTTIPFRSRARTRLFGFTQERAASDRPAGTDGSAEQREQGTEATEPQAAERAPNGAESMVRAEQNDIASRMETSTELQSLPPRERPSEAYKRRLAAMTRRRYAASGTQTAPSKTSSPGIPAPTAPLPTVPAYRNAAEEIEREGTGSVPGDSSVNTREVPRPAASPATIAALDRVRRAAEGGSSSGDAVAEAELAPISSPHDRADGIAPASSHDGEEPLDDTTTQDGTTTEDEASDDRLIESDDSPDDEARSDENRREEGSGNASFDIGGAAPAIEDGDEADDDRPLVRTPPPVDTTLLGRLPVPVLVQNAKGLLYANPPFLKLTGYATLDELTKAGGMEVLFDSTILPGSADATGEPMRLQRADGTRRPVSAQMQTVPWTSDEGESEGAFLLTVRAADDRGRPLPDMPDEVMPGAIEDRLVSLNAVLDEATDGVVFLDADRNIRSLSRSAAALLGYSGEEIRGRSFAVLFAPESQRAALDLIGSMGGKGPRRRSGIELTGLTVADDEVPLFVTVGALRDEGGFCAVLRDVSDWRRAENELRAARDEAEAASREKSRFLTRVSHEIRTPLNAIIGFAEVMAEERLGPVSNQRYREYLADIRSSGRHVLDLVNDLLDIAKIEAGRDDLRFEAVDVNSELEDAVSILQLQATEGRVIVRTALNPMPPVVADKRSVKQIAINILSNAIRYTEPGGQVIVSTKLTDEGVTARIRDTGVGMSQDDIDRALEPFAQAPSRSESMARRSRAGTGLGLPLSKAMAEANRAHFTLSSVRGRGTLVELRFPKDRILD